jgi:hypothetical protein
MHCLNCHSIFFKTLEVRVLPFEIQALLGEDASQVTLLYKKRCKRCKHKYYYRKDFPGEATQPVAYSLWMSGRKINLPGARPDARPQLIASEYSKRVGHAAEDNLAYMRRLEKAQKTQKVQP